ncbi:MAG TPA: hypothetical protein DCO79_12680 [Spirochaeta sp.]|nr:hypothetical protein [Spirochaeta sp.]
MKENTYLHTIKAAEKLFNRFGFAKTAMSDIAKASDVSRATIFNNFGNKEGVLKAVLDNKRKEFRASITRRIAKTHSISGQMKAILIERIKMLSAMKYISEGIIAVDNETVNVFFKEMNRFFMKKITDVLTGSGRGKEEIKRLINTILFMMKGIEQGVSEQLESFSLKQVEQDIDYFLKLAVPEEQEERAQ